MTQQTIDNVYVDWLGNQISVGDWVLYSSKSTNTGMNLGKVEYVGPSKNPSSKRRITQIRVFQQSSGGWSEGKLITLSSGDGAYKSTTKYFGLIPDTQNLAWTN